MKNQAPRQRKGWTLVGTLTITGITAFLIILFRDHYGLDLQGIVLGVKELLYWPTLTAMQKTLKSTLLSPIFYGGFTLVFFLERFFPAKRDQKFFSVSMAQDALWLVYDAFFKAVVIVGYVHFLHGVYDKHLNFLTITAVDQWSMWGKIGWAIVFADFLAWFHHWVRHKVPWFWHFHTIHHSQKHINLFTDLRYHFVEYLVSRTIIVFPLLMFKVDVTSIVYFNILKEWFTHIYHGNIKSNYGIFRYIFVTPQSHRIHHSLEPQHQDKNFGVLFSIWDYIFQTQYRKYDEYPETGIADESFPHETTAAGLSLLTTSFKQLLYPFQAIARSLSSKETSQED